MNLKTYEIPSSLLVLRPALAKQGAAAVKLVMPLVLSFTAGTGGTMTAHGAEMLDRWAYDPSIHVERPAVRSIDTRSPGEHVALIRDAFALNMSELAAVLGVTRPTTYAWLEGQEPKPETLMHIQRLSRAAEELKRLRVPRIDTLVRRPMLNGRSLLDQLKANEDPIESLAVFKVIAEKEAQSRRTLKGSGKRPRSLDEVANEYSTPSYDRS